MVVVVGEVSANNPSDEEAWESVYVSKLVSNNAKRGLSSMMLMQRKLSECTKKTKDYKTCGREKMAVPQ